MELTSEWRSPALLCTTFVRWDTCIKEIGKWREGKREEEEGLRVRCEFVGGPDGSALLTDSKPSGRGEEVLHAPLESSSSSSQSSRLETFAPVREGQGRAARGVAAGARRPRQGCGGTRRRLRCTEDRVSHWQPGGRVWPVESSAREFPGIEFRDP